MEEIVKKRIKMAFGRTALAFFTACFLAGCGLMEQIETFQTEILERETHSGVSVKQDTETAVKKAPEKKKKKKKKETKTQEEDVLQKDTEEERFALNYAYQTLGNEARAVYREMLSAVLEQKEKTEVSTLDADVLEAAYKALCADYGGLFWISGYVYTQYTRDGEAVGMEFSPKYTMRKEEREAIQKQIDASVEELMAGISITDSDYAKAKYVFEILVQNVDYDSNARNSQNIISVFLDRATVCQGYACATQYLLNLLGIPGVIVTGTANGESHAWNLVRLDGAYYYMDTTWGNSRYLDSASQMEKYVNYNYLAITSEEISRTHTLDNGFPLPECTHMEDNYFVKENRYFTEWNPERIGALLAEKWNAGGGDASVKFASQELYAQAIAYFITDGRIADYCPDISSIYYLEDKELYVLTFHL